MGESRSYWPSGMCRTPNRQWEGIAVGKPQPFDKFATFSIVSCGSWRRGWDSNPRYRLRYTPLAGERLRPLGHLSTRVAVAEESAFSKGIGPNFSYAFSCIGLRYGSRAEPEFVPLCGWFFAHFCSCSVPGRGMPRPAGMYGKNTPSPDAGGRSDCGRRCKHAPSPPPLSTTSLRKNPVLPARLKFAASSGLMGRVSGVSVSSNAAESRQKCPAATLWKSSPMAPHIARETLYMASAHSVGHKV